MQIGTTPSPLSLAMLKTLGSQLAPAASAPAPQPDLGAAAPQRNEPAGPPEPGRIVPRGSFVDLKA